MKRSSNTFARDFSLKFLFHLSLPESGPLFHELLSIDEPVSALKNEWDHFDKSYTEIDIEHPNNTLPKESYHYAKFIVNHVFSNYKSLIETISPYLQKRAINKIDKMDFWILMIANTEFRFSKKIAKNIIINEAIELAKKYGDNDSYSLINGVLDKISKKEFCS